jgi:hypothetical protein
VKLNETYQSLKTTQIDWCNFLVNPRYNKEDHIISWKRYKPRLKLISVHRSDVLEMVNEKQYSFQVIDDGSIFQLYYEYDRQDQILLRANLSFFNTGGISYEAFQEQLYAEFQSPEINSKTGLTQLEEIVDTDDEDPIVPWLRIDYVPQNYFRPLHHSCHMHIGLFQNARFTLTGVPSPRQFVEFVITLCYPLVYKEKRLDNNLEPQNFSQIANLNKECFKSIESRVYQILPYLSIPTHEVT